MRWDEVLDPRLAAYRAGSLAGKRLRAGGVVPSGTTLTVGDTELVAKAFDVPLHVLGVDPEYPATS
jgi:hypothetical protein